MDSLKGGQAHVDFDEVVHNFRAELQGKKPPHASHSGWQLLEHLRIAQHDILEFCRDPKYTSPAWPEGYWPAEAAPPEPYAWENSVAAFKKDHQDFIKLIGDPEQDLLAKLPHGEGQTLLREALLVIDHNAYHLGQLVMLRTELHIWPGK